MFVSYHLAKFTVVAPSRQLPKIAASVTSLISLFSITPNQQSSGLASLSELFNVITNHVCCLVLIDSSRVHYMSYFMS